VQAFVIAVSDR
jgi:hypothetical protein